MPPSVCDGETFVTDTGFLFDFEGEDTDELWFSFGDDTDGATKDDLAPEAGGALGTPRGGHFSGSGFDDWGAGTNLTLGCWDVSAFDGLSFWARGTEGSEIDFQMVLPDTHAVEEGGDCAEACFDHPRTTIELTDEWTQHSVIWSELEQQGWGTEGEYRGIIMGFVWTTAGPDFDFWLDEIALYAGTPPDAPVGSGASDGGGAVEPQPADAGSTDDAGVDGAGVDDAG